MATRAELKAVFQNGVVLTETDFASLIDSLAQATEDDLQTGAEVSAAITAAIAGKQNTLVSGTNIKTINGVSVLGAGDLTVEAGAASTLHADVVSFADRQTANGNYVDTQTLAALDRFVRRGVAKGWYAAVVEMYAFVGNNLAAALEKFKYHASSGPTLTNIGFVEADYDQKLGFGTYNEAETTKWLATGLVPNAVGMTDDTLGVFACAGDLPSTFGLGTDTYVDPEKTALSYNATGTIAIANATGLAVGNTNGTLKVTGASCYAGGARGWIAGVQITDTYPSDSIGLGSEVMIFRYKLWGSQQWAQGKAGCVVFTNVALTAAQGSDLCHAIRDLQVEIGRTAWQPLPTVVSIGDSNTQGANSWAATVVKSLGMRHINTAANSVALSTSGTVGLVALVDQRVYYAALPGSLFLHMLGTNDVNNNDIPVATYQAALDLMIAELTRRKMRVLLLSIPYNSYSTAPKVASYVAAAKTVANTYGIPFLNAYNVIGDKANPDADWTQGDGTHMNDPGNLELARFAIMRLRGLVVREQILDFGSIAAGASVDSTTIKTITVDQVQPGDKVVIDPPAGFETGLVVRGWISATDTLVIRVTNLTGAPIDPGSGVYTAYVEARL